MTAGEASRAPQGVAIIGIGCRFPGGVTDAASFWRLLSEGRDVIGEIPSSRIDIGHYFDARPATPGRIMTRWGGFLEHLEDFDPLFFGMSPREAERLDPQQRLLLETAWEALEDAGQDMVALEGSATGIFVGQWLSDFEGRLFADPEAVDFYMTTGSGRYASSGRLSYLLGLHGPSLTVDTACSSSLIAVHLAVRSIRSGESTLALAGGANVILQPHISVAYSQSRMMAPDGRCKFGDASGDGYVRSEGAGLVVLKALDRALADGDRIYAVIRGSATNNDGRTSGSMGTPSRVGQEALLRSAYRDASVSPGSVGYVEAHGTGTRAGDPVELGALSAVLCEGRANRPRARVGSVKTNFGHTEGAAGIAGLMKAALALHHAAIPPSLHCKTPNPVVPWDTAPVEIPRALTPWPDNAFRRFAGVSAFGIAGANAHVVLEAAPPGVALLCGKVSAVHLLPLSTRSIDALRALAGRYAQLLAGSSDADVGAICANAALRRTALENRAVLAGRNREELKAALDRFAAGESALAEGVAANQPRIVYIVPGQGAQWVGMARELAASEPVFREALERCDRAARPYVDWSIVEQLALAPGTPGYRLDKIDVIQPVLIAMAIAYAAWLESLGVKPDAVVGHSMGEVGAAYLAGVLTLEQAMRIICRRSLLMGRTSGRGAMAMVDLSMADAQKRLAGRESTVSVAVSNSPRSCVISGDPAAVKEVLAECERDGIFCRLVKVDVASHSPQMESPAADLAAELSDFTPSESRVPIYSTVLGRAATGTEFDARYWGRNMRQPVRFTESVTALLEAGFSVFVELGPHPVLVPAVQQTAQARGGSVVTLSCGRREEADPLTALAAVTGIWCAGAPIHWSRLTAPSAFVSLPLYPWQRERYWCDAAEQNRDGGARRSSRKAGAPAFPMLGAATPVAGVRPGSVWDTQLLPSRDGYLLEHRLHGAPLLAASVYLELAFEAQQAIANGRESTLHELRFEQALHVSPDAPIALQMHYLPQAAGGELSWYSPTESGWIRHARARTGASPESVPAAQAAAQIRARCTTELSSEAMYSGLAARGASFGPTLRSVVRAWAGTDELLAELSPDSAQGARERRTVASAALDACFQVAVTAGPGEGLWLPSRVDRACLYRAANGPLFVHARRRSSEHGDSAVLDVSLFDSDGIVVMLQGVKLERLGASVASDPRRWLYDIAWQEISAAPATAPSATTRRWLILDAQRGAGLRDALVAAIGKRGDECRVLGSPDASSAEMLSRELSFNGRVELLDLRALDLSEVVDSVLAAALARFSSLVALVATSGARNVRIRAVTRNARAVHPKERSRVMPSQAAFWGAGATVAVEHGDIWAGCIDLEAGEADATTAAALLAHVLSDGAGDASLRDGKALAPRLHRFELDVTASRPPVAFRPGASYLLTGGLGGVGIHLASALVQQGARRLVILGRTPVPPRVQWRSLAGTNAAAAALVSGIQSLESQGASVHYASVDVGDPAALSAFLESYAAEGLPPIRGVVHAAGVTDDRLIAQIDADSWSRVLHGKAAGAWNLHRSLPDLEIFVLFSSVAALLPEPGQCSYSAANSVLDALALVRQGEGKPALSVGWGVWSGIGVMKGEAGQRKLQQLEQRGLHGFQPEKALELFPPLLQSGAAHVVVFPADWAAFHQSQAGRVPAIVLDQVAALSANAPAAVASEVPLASLDPAARRKHVEQGVRDAAARVLKLSPARIDARKPLGSMGLSSLLAMELRNRLELLMGRPLSATLAWNYPTVDALVGFLCGDSTAAAPKAPAEAPAAPNVAIEKIADISDADAALLLRRRR